VSGDRPARDIRIQRFSPSLVNILLDCPFREAIYRSGCVPRRRTTYTSLGNAAHRITERGWKHEFDGLSGPALRESLAVAWGAIVDHEYAKLRESVAPAEPPPPRDWPGIALTRARLLRRLGRLIEARSAHTGGDGFVAPEHEIRDEAGGVYGRIDRIERVGGRLRVVDLKSGLSQGEMSDKQRRQLLIYAYLVHLEMEEWPFEVAIETADGTQHAIPVDPQEVEQVLLEARGVVGAFNDRASDGIGGMVGLAHPAPDTCRYCDGRLVCEPYWAAARADWSTWPCFRGVVTEVLDAGPVKSVRIAVNEPLDRRGASVEVFGQTGDDPAAGRIAAVVGAYGDPAGVKVRLGWDSQVSWDAVPLAAD
jgi:hypothetical protein